MRTELQIFPSLCDRYRHSEELAKPLTFRKKGEKVIVADFPTKYDISQIWIRTAVKFSMTGRIIMTVSHFESVMDHWINATAFLNYFSILSNYDFKILLYKITIQCTGNNAVTSGITKLSSKQGWYVSCPVHPPPRSQALRWHFLSPEGLPHSRCSIHTVILKPCDLWSNRQHWMSLDDFGLIK